MSDGTHDRTGTLAGRHVLRMSCDDDTASCDLVLALTGGCLELSWRRGLVRVVATHAKEDGMPKLWVEPALQVLFLDFYGYTAAAFETARRLRDSVEEQIEELTGWRDFAKQKAMEGRDDDRGQGA